MVQTGLWYDVPCDGVYETVCMDVKGSDVTFFLIKKTMTWTEAQNYCRTNYTDLASVRNMTENQKIQDLKEPEDKVWIGLFRDSWKWLDGSDSSFRFWRVGEPNNNYDKETCVAANFDISGTWEDWSCDWKREFICYSPPPTTKRVIRLRVLKTSAQDLNDPAVNEQMLEQLRQRLKDQGVNPDDVKLSWRKQADGKVFHKEEKKTEKKTKKTEL
ncbi:Lactose-binding lectin l-2 [Collichthys lucidus]|uniref:Lactose-binding lectin l-2 n=1 Tax=Collichthys lucidus TaxID=240159 RepID=A0A4U5USA4_COLLU|nr:Lactose-binding lectin l-2 [Collichthys lucidus]